MDPCVLQGEDPESREEAGLSVEEEPGPGHAKALPACLKARGNAAAGGQREELWSQGNHEKPLAMTMTHREERLWLGMLPGQGHTVVLR